MAHRVDHEAGQTQTQTNGVVAQNGSKSLQQDALNRIRTLTGGIMIMACPVLLAIAVNKVNPKTGGIIWMAALTLEAGICPFVTLCISNATANLCPRISGYLFVASKLLVHLCAILLMVLAYGILLLISKGNLPYMVLLIVFAVSTLLLCYLSVKNSPATYLNNPATTIAPMNSPAMATDSTNSQATATDQTNSQDTATAPMITSGGDRQKQEVTMLENLVEFSVAGTSIVFLGLQGLALERLSRIATAKPTPTPLDRDLLKASHVLSFFTCLFGVFVMLPGVVPPPQLMTGVKGDSTTKLVEGLNIVLAIFIGMTVILIASAAVKELACLVVVPALVSFMVWMFIQAFDGETIGKDVKPASLDLTKVTFTGFLAVSVTAIGNVGHHPVSFWEQAFILLTSAAVVAGIVWRFLTHRTGQSRAIVVAANVASVCAHACVAFAVVPFAVMAFKRGGASAGAAGPAPAPPH